ncbi:hypothetical protein CRV15_34715 (plasmid) [Streptomyces clavuligerus]|uniref:Uncharacterized protein n=1 Tax=Streptomyces clavuligerus TaxID=1901 RepID=B5H1E6_STRCL|nr:hypothetical protein SSCG_05420 [Streptomyces clavuligerus]EFG04839.1 Hypothetical protein SCLAV_p1355 [Streptomyces clavuligerus]QCS10677.1 hypothetical protein CRV15_34715 [Streptomyces clavuligerus]QPJ97286.1 hypothetical protein GE265_29760 [Streptomyces clavuligerus]
MTRQNRRAGIRSPAHADERLPPILAHRPAPPVPDRGHRLVAAMPQDGAAVETTFTEDNGNEVLLRTAEKVRLRHLRHPFGSAPRREGFRRLRP